MGLELNLHYGIRIYDVFEMEDGYGTYTNQEHYKEIAKANKSIPQIKRTSQVHL